jgi:hypothetical protein
MPKIVTSTLAPVAITKLAFLKRLTFAERVAIETAAQTDPEVRVVKESLMAANEIRVDDPEMVAGIELYVAKGLITEERKKIILT